MAEYGKTRKDIQDFLDANDAARREAKAAAKLSEAQRERILGKPATPSDAAKGAVALVKGSARLSLAFLFVISIVGGLMFPALWLGSVLILLLALVVKES